MGEFIIFILACVSWYYYHKYNVNKMNHTDLERKISRLTIDLAYERHQHTLLKVKASLLESAVTSANYRESNSTKIVNIFSKDELTKIRFYLHPDKTGGKTHDLFLKVNKELNK